MSISSEHLNIYLNERSGAPVKTTFKKLIPLLPNKFDSLIDVGCSNGECLKYIHKLYPKAKLTGIDFEKEYEKCFEEEPIKYYNLNITKTVPDIKADVVLCFGLMSLYKNPDILIENLLKLLKSNGSLIILDSMDTKGVDYHIKYRRGGTLDSMKYEYYSCFYSKETLERIADKNNAYLSAYPFELDFSIDKHNKWNRTWTEPFRGNPNHLFLPIGLALSFYYIKIRFKNKPLMIHQVHKDYHYAKGSIHIDKLEELIIKLGDNILNIEDWIIKYNNGTLKPLETCITLDDGLLSQYKLVLPLLKKYNIQACWSIASSALTKNLPMEGLKYLIKEHYENKEDIFYKRFFHNIREKLNVPYDLKKALNYRSDIKFYSNNERIVRYLRDKILSKNEFDDIVNSVLEGSSIPRLSMSEHHIKELIEYNQVIANHTHSHGTNFEKVSKEYQFRDFNRCNNILKKLGISVKFATLPCGRSNEDTNNVLSELGIKHVFGIDDNVNIPRMDIVDVI